MKKKVLIIDDDETQSLGLAQLIRACWKIPEISLEIVCVMTLADGLREAAEANVTIIDLTLLDATEDEVIASIPSFQPPVIVLTGNDDPVIAARCYDAKAEHVFVKGSIVGFIPSVFKSLARDLIQRAELNGA